MDKIFWTYWHQGEKEAPIVVKECIKRWRKLNPDWQIIVLDQWTVNDYAAPLPLKKEKLNQLPLPHQSDLIRTQLLIKYGGVWTDPTCFPVKPLDEWIFDYLDAGLFLFTWPGKDRPIANWFIAAEKGNEFLEKLYERLNAYWSENQFKNLQGDGGKVEWWAKRLINGRSAFLSQVWLTPIFTKLLRLYPYMVYHYMFYNLTLSDKQCRKIWKKMPGISADGPHQLQKFGLESPITKGSKEIIDETNLPLLKLKWKLKSEKVPENSNLNYLIG